MTSLLQQRTAARARAARGTTPVRVAAGAYTVRGDLHAARDAAGLVIAVHGSGVTRRSAQSRAIGRRLQRAGFATLLVDLLEEYETRYPSNLFAVGMQADRLAELIRSVRRAARTRALPLGLFGAGIGAGVVLVAAANAAQTVRAVVCRCGRPDSAATSLPGVKAPTLFIDEHPQAVPNWCEAAYRAMRAPARIVRLSSATLDDEAAAMEAVARHAERWFRRHLARGSGAIRPAERPG